MKISENTKQSIISYVDGMIADVRHFVGKETTRKDYRAYVDCKKNKAIIMSQEDEEDPESWGGHLYNIVDEKLEVEEYEAFENEDIEGWPIYDYEEVNIDS